MKNILILHGSFGNPDKNWYRYVEKEAAKKGYLVNIPQLEVINKLDVDSTIDSLIKNYINSETILIGHSSGATLGLLLLQKLDNGDTIKKGIFVAGFMDDNLGNDLLKFVPKEYYAKLFKDSWNWDKIKSSCKEFVFMCSPNDPYVPPVHSKNLYLHLGGELVVIPDSFHFSVNTGGIRFKKLPEILRFI